MSKISSISDPRVAGHLSTATKRVVQELGSTTNDSRISPQRAPLPVRIYTPEPALGHPVRLIREMAVDIWSGRELAWRLFIRDLSASYRQAWFGYAWVFLPPSQTLSRLSFSILKASLRQVRLRSLMRRSP